MGLARALAKAGYGTRTRAQAIVREGRVKVDERVALDPSTTVGPDSTILLDNQPLVKAIPRYFAFHKPARVPSLGPLGVGRRTVVDYLPAEIPGLSPAGRLDLNTSGLMLVSNDNTWNSCAAGSSCLEKEYKIQVSGQITGVEVGVILAGMHLPHHGFIRPLAVDILEARENQTILRLVLGEGKNRQVRKIFNALRHDVVMMRRIRIGPVVLKNLLAGHLRPLTRGEIEGIRVVGLKSS
jgi:23S rRNA pseudouridine2605 synthase